MESGASLYLQIKQLAFSTLSVSKDDVFIGTEEFYVLNSANQVLQEAFSKWNDTVLPLKNFT